MADKLRELVVLPRGGGFIIRAEVKQTLDDGNEVDVSDEYVVSSYGKLFKALKSEFEGFKPARKPRAKKEVA